MLLGTYYAQNYAGIIGRSLVLIKCLINVLSTYLAMEFTVILLKLIDRKVVNQAKSKSDFRELHISELLVKSGVPQGTVLEPLLFR